jgi:hypothetical protein
MAFALETLLAGTLYLPFLAMPFALLFWYAFSASPLIQSDSRFEETDHLP